MKYALYARDKIPENRIVQDLNCIHCSDENISHTPFFITLLNNRIFCRCDWCGSLFELMEEVNVNNRTED